MVKTAIKAQNPTVETVRASEVNGDVSCSSPDTGR